MNSDQFPITREGALDRLDAGQVFHRQQAQGTRGGRTETRSATRDDGGNRRIEFHVKCLLYLVRLKPFNDGDIGNAAAFAHRLQTILAAPRLQRMEQR